METFSKAIGMVIFIVLIFIFPMIYQSQRYDTIAQSYVSNVTDDFVNKICETGEITESDYTDFISTLNKSGNLYEVNMSIKSVSLTKTASGTLENTESEITNDTIIKQLYSTSLADGSQNMIKIGSGSYINVVVKNKNKTLSTRLQQVFYATVIDNPTIYVTDGGVIR